METTSHVIWDIETEGHADEDLVRAITPPYPPFDESTVKTGNCKSPEQSSEKIEAARLQHHEQEAAYWAEKMEKRALRAETGRIVTIGYLPLDAPDEDALLDDAGFDEARLLRRFWAVFERCKRERTNIIGWNSGAGMSCGFDLAYCIKRSWILGVQIPKGVTKGRFVSDVFVDLMLEWGLHAFREFCKLDHCARALGIGNKTEQECSGAEFAAWYRDPAKHERAVHYGKLDLILTREIYLKLYQHAPQRHLVS